MKYLNKALLVSAISCFALLPAGAQSPASDPTTVVVGKTPLMHIIVGADGMSAAQRATLIQRSLDSALLSAPGSQPNVAVELFGQTPVLMLNGHYIASADADTARAMNMEPLDLARKWAHDLRLALENQVAVGDIAYDTRTLSATIPQTSVQVPAQKMRFARMPAGLTLPVALETDVHTSAMRPGDEVVADTVADVALPTGEVLPAGTHLFADVVPLDTNSMFGVGTLGLSYERMQLSDGTEIPISASVSMNGRNINTFILPPGSDMAYPAGTRFILKLNTPAQVAVTGTTL